MAIKNVTRWYPSYISGSDGGNLLTQSGVPIVTQSGVNITVNPNVFKPKAITSWTKSLKNITSWRPLGGAGYVVSAGTLNITDNLGNLLTDNIGDFIVTNPTYTSPKNVTVWTASGA